MLKHRGGPFIAMIGWLLLVGASPEQKQRQVEKRQDEHHSAESLHGAGAPLKSPDERADPKRECDPADDDRHSHLCAEWKAADAAEESAYWDEKSFWVGALGELVGILTLGAAFLAAFYARIAAMEARRSAEAALDAVEENRIANKLAKESAESDLRAWVSIEADLKSASRTEKAAHFSLIIKLKNLGKTPALRVSLGLHVYCTQSMRIGNGDPPDIARRRSSMPAMMPGGQVEHGIGERISTEEISAAIAKAERQGTYPIVFADVVVSYHTIFDGSDAPPRISSARYSITPPWDFGTYPNAMREWLINGPKDVDSVVFKSDNAAPIHVI